MLVLSELDHMLGRAVDAGDVPGVVTLAADDHGVLYSGAFGQRELGKPIPMTLDSVFWIASMTKAVTSVAAMQLVERRRVALDEPLAERLPDLVAVQVLEGFDAAGRPALRAPRRAMTLRHLLTHTAGFAYPTWNSKLRQFHEYAGVPFGHQHSPMVFDSGDRWEYGISIDWVGRLVEVVSGQSLEEYFRQHVLDPLGMVDTGFVLRADQRARLVGRHQRQPDGSLRALEAETPTAPAFYNGGGGLYSTGPDYLRFLRMLLGGGQLEGEVILQPESVMEIARNQIGELNVGVLRSTTPDRSNDVEFFPGTIMKWGFGGLINTQPSTTGRSAGSWAWAGLANTYFWIDPARHVAGLILTQILPFCDPKVLRLFSRFERAIYASIDANPVQAA
jgi:CubicO group peptidase (beta-lactamase class C family)